MDILKIFGLGQKRCAHCLEPFFPVEIDNLEFLPSPLLCAKCQKLFINYSGPQCKLCGNPYLDAESQQSSRKDIVCDNCAKEPPPWIKFVYFGLYTGPLRDIILRLKFDHDLYLTKLLSDFLLNISYCLSTPDILIPIPQYPSSLCKRGYNQVLEITRSFSLLSHLPISTKLLKKTRKSLPQEGLSAVQRRENIKGVFSCSEAVKNKAVWLIDDVMTSGATCREASKVLIAAGAKHVTVICLARTHIF